MTSGKVNSFAPGLKLPEFKLVRPDEMLANKNHGMTQELSLVLQFTTRFPFQPEMPAYPKALIKDVRLEQLRKDRSLLLMTDAAFHRLALEHARRENIAARIEGRRLIEMDGADRHSEAVVAGEDRRRVNFFQKVLEIVVRRQAGHLKARALEQSLWDFIREYAKKHGDQDVATTRKLIRIGFERHAKYLAWRLDDLYITTANHSFVKGKGNGHKIEAVLGRLLWDVRAAITRKHHEWRVDSLYTAMPNGGIARVHHTSGRSLELVAAQAHEPLIHRRTERFHDWRDSNTQVETPNHNLVHAHLQGKMPEAMSAQIHEPLIDERSRKALEWHMTHLMTTLANGSFTPLKSHHGNSVEKVTGDLAWDQKGKITHKHADWRLGNLASPTPNGGFMHLKSHHGQTFEKVAFDVDRPHKEAVTKGHDEWHKGHMFGPTPNAGFAPLKGHGHSYEAASAAAAQPRKDKTHQAAHDWHASHAFNHTSNGGMAPLKNLGHSIESITAEIADKPKHTATERFEHWRATHRFKETPNHAFAPILNVGGSFEKVSSDFTTRIKDGITRRFYEKRADEMWAPTENGNWRRLSHVGKSMPHVTGEVARPSEGNDGDGTLPSAGGHVLESAKHKIAERRGHVEKRAFREIQRSLAAHQETVSRMHGHVTRPSSVDSATNPDTLPLLGPDRAKKTE